MTLNSLVSKLSEYLSWQHLSWLYYGREWSGWELLTIAMTALVLLLLIVRRQQKAKARRMKAKQTKENSPIIGIKLADSKGTQQGIQDSEKHRLAFVSERDRKQQHWRETTEKWKKLKEQIEQLRHEITKYKQAEEHLKQRLANLKAAYETLQHEISKYRQAEEQPEQLTTEPETVDEPLQRNITERGQAEQMLKENTKETKRSKRLSGPMDVEQLKAIAAFAKQLRGRYRRFGEQSPDPAISGKSDSG